jgi:NADH-quinone oxidoreductase subunit L
MSDDLVSLVAFVVVAGPLTLFATLGSLSLIGRPASERTTGLLIPTTLASSAAAAVALAAGSPLDRLDLSLGAIVAVEGYRFELRLLFDWLSIPFLLLSLFLCGVTGLFAHRYLHREPGYNRFFALYSLFAAGMTLSSVAGSLETMIAGWELVGLASVLLIAFFHERPEPMRNGLRVWTVYRIGDLGLLFAAALALHWTGSGAFGTLFGSTDAIRSTWAFGLLLLLAVMAKSALVPLSSWLPRAMEGPTPSSAIFYGALSVHLGAFLLLRAAPVLDANPGLSWLVAGVGLATALHGSMVGRAQTDIKCALAYASLTQVGIIVAEIGFGLRLIPLLHILGHACVRTLQFLRAPSLLHDLHQVENAIGSHLPRSGIRWELLLPEGLRRRWYRAALERGYLEAFLREWVAGPFLAAVRLFDRLESWWVRRIGGNSA